MVTPSPKAIWAADLGLSNTPYSSLGPREVLQSRLRIVTTLGSAMAKRPRKNRLERWEVAMVKALLATKGRNDQDVLAYFTRPNRSINHRVIAEIRTGRKHKNLKPASEAELANFLANWPLVDHKTGLHLLGDELLIKAREAMICAVQSYNNPATYFKSEVFIVTAIIAWTYLMHAFYKSKAIDYRHRQKRDGKSVVVKTKQGADKHWELSQCLKHGDCPLDGGTVRNLEFLVELRHEIEHRMTKRIDHHMSAKLQACCLNFDRTLRQLFGEQYSMGRDLSMALQFASIEGEQRRMLLREEDLPGHIQAMQDTFQGRLTEEEFNDPHYAYRVAYVPKTANRRGSADTVVEFVKEGSEEAEKVSRVLVKDTEKQKYKPKQIVLLVRSEGYRWFTMADHTDLWKALDAKDPKKSYGVRLNDGQWYWYENWVNRVREHCQERQVAKK